MSVTPPVVDPRAPQQVMAAHVVLLSKSTSLLLLCAVWADVVRTRAGDGHDDTAARAADLTGLEYLMAERTMMQGLQTGVLLPNGGVSAGAQSVLNMAAREAMGMPPGGGNSGGSA